MNRRLFLKRAFQSSGIVVMLPAAKSLGAIEHARKAGYYEHTILAMGTTARLGVYARGEEAANEVITACFEELKRIESLLTIFNPSSEISKLNSNAGGGFLFCSADTVAILVAAKQYASLTDGAFEATVEPLMRLWGFRNDNNVLSQLPSDIEVADALRFIGSDHIELRDSSARLTIAGAKLDLGGIAVGYSLDKMVAMLHNAGIEDAFIDISGDMFALGKERGKRGWDVAIPDPQDTAKLIYHATISNEALATSGNYESFVVYQAQRFGHIMDPHQGRSSVRMLSSTAIAKTGLDADALSTASFVSGKAYGTSRLIGVNKIGTLTVT